MEQQAQQPIREKTESKPPMKTNWKYLAIVVVIVGLVGGVLLVLISEEAKRYQEVVTTEETTPVPEVYNQSGESLQRVILQQGDKTQIVIPKTRVTHPANQCSKYGSVDKSFYLDTYTVRKGDALFSILKNQSENPSRIYEFIELNKDRFRHLSLENPFIEVGWELYLPPKFIQETNGNLAAYYAGVVEETDNYWNINTWGKDYSLESPRYTVIKIDKTKYLGGNAFHSGDCIVMVVQNASTAIAISPQDKNYFKEPQRFISTLYNYLIEYPRGWTTNGYGDDPQDNKMPGSGYHERYFDSTNIEKEKFVVKVWDTRKTAMRVEFLQDTARQLKWRNKDIQEIVIYGVKATKAVGGTPADPTIARIAGEIPRDFALGMVVFQKGNYVYALQFEGVDLTNFEEMLSSFRFLQ